MNQSWKSIHTARFLFKDSDDLGKNIFGSPEIPAFAPGGEERDRLYPGEVKAKANESLTAGQLGGGSEVRQKGDSSLTWSPG